MEELVVEEAGIGKGVTDRAASKDGVGLMRMKEVVVEGSISSTCVCICKWWKVEYFPFA